jgi:hypothetical protein
MALQQLCAGPACDLMGCIHISFFPSFCCCYIYISYSLVLLLPIRKEKPDSFVFFFFFSLLNVTWARTSSSADDYRTKLQYNFMEEEIKRSTMDVQVSKSFFFLPFNLVEVVFFFPYFVIVKYTQFLPWFSSIIFFVYPVFFRPIR